VLKIYESKNIFTSVQVTKRPQNVFKKYIDFNDSILKLDPLEPSHMLSKFFTEYLVQHFT
jgi:hypothetical protein